MSKSAFGSSVPKFTCYGIHPKLQSTNSFYSKSVSPNVGPGSYNIKHQEKSSKNRYSSEMWKVQYNLEKQKTIPYFMVKERKQAEAEMKKKLGPGYYEIEESMKNLLKNTPTTTILQSKAPRFSNSIKDCYPGPSTYGIPQDIIDQADIRRKYANSVPLLDRGGNSNRLSTPPSFHIGPGIYNIESPINKVLSHQTGKRGYYDCNNLDRSQPIKTGHHTILVSHNLGPGEYNFGNEIDRFHDKFHCFKGKFLREKQYPEKPHQRVFWSDPGNTPVDKANQVSPASYDVSQTVSKNRKSKAGFGSSDIRMNKFALANFMGENNTLIGPGRYNCDSKGIGESGNSFESVFKSLVSKISDPKTIDVLRSRVRPINLPEMKKYKETHLATENSLREYNNSYDNLKSLVIS